MEFVEIAKQAKTASLEIADLSTEIKNRALLAIADSIEQNKAEIFEANKKDLTDAESLVTSGEISKSTFNRLKLDENKMRDMVQGILPRDVDCTLELHPGKSINDVHKHTGCALSMGPVVGRNFPVLLHGGCEIAVCHDLYKDAMRRDFTINAMFLTCKQDPKNKDNREILTIPGTWKDLNNGVLRMHGDMFQKFKDDPIRILRALRFAAGSKLIIEDNLHYKIHALRDLVKSPSVPKEARTGHTPADPSC